MPEFKHSLIVEFGKKEESYQRIWRMGHSPKDNLHNYIMGLGVVLYLVSQIWTLYLLSVLVFFGSTQLLSCVGLSPSSIYECLGHFSSKFVFENSCDI